jgi:hypothetical protein
MTDPAPTNPSEDRAQVLEAEVQQTIDLCNGDLRAALRTTLIANAFLKAEVERLSADLNNSCLTRALAVVALRCGSAPDRKLLYCRSRTKRQIFSSDLISIV